ncbi:MULTISPECIES: hypothetical protein [unclassified Solwaraspora]|uniref:hypothetical protein n=1 Tax=unclassified Solwaraspora TaxID=2627926 RepID=UPI00259B3D0E|nr:hypothetical protein [Solwaraspora sp. WMMA2056]WJK41136.1 hypothetical protein O7608_01350 [Solwaraspora sp. WMMA2056]
MDSVGFQVAVFTPEPEVLENAVRGRLSETASAEVGWPGTKVPSPVVDTAGPDQ